MSSSALANAIRSRYVDQVLSVQAVATQYDNQIEFNKPPAALWCRLIVQESDSTRLDIADHPRVRTLGRVVFNIFGPLDEGDAAARALADLIVSKFRHVTDTGVKYRTPSVQAVGRSDAWWQINVIAPFQYDEVT